MPNHSQFVFIRETCITGFAVVLVVVLVCHVFLCCLVRHKLDRTGLTGNLGAPMPDLCHVRFCCCPILKQLVALVAFLPWFSMAHFSHVLLACFLSSKRFRACLAFSHLHSLVVVVVDDVEISIVRAKRNEA